MAFCRRHRGQATFGLDIRLMVCGLVPTYVVNFRRDTNSFGSSIPGCAIRLAHDSGVS